MRLTSFLTRKWVIWPLRVIALPTVVLATVLSLPMMLFPGASELPLVAERPEWLPWTQELGIALAFAGAGAFVLLAVLHHLENVQEQRRQRRHEPCETRPYGSLSDET